MKEKELFVVLDDTTDIGKAPEPITDEHEQKIHDELLAKYKNKYLKHKAS